MSLTSAFFLTTLGLIAAGSVVGAWFLWPRLAGPGWQRGAGRAGTLVLVQVTGVALVAGLVNAQFDFYPTLPSLFGSEGVTALQGDSRPLTGWVSTQAPDAAVVALNHPVHTPWGDLWRDPRSAAWGAGSSLEGDLRGAVSHLANGRLRVWLPQQYDDPAYRHYAFPVVVSLSGYPGNPVSWWKTGFPARAQAAIDDHTVTPFIFVALTPDPSPTRDTECTNVPRGPQAETFLASDLPDDVTHLLRAAAPGVSWALMGDSTGGYCSTKLAMDHPRSFPTAISFGGYFHAITDVTTGNLDGGSLAHRRMRDLIWKATHLPLPRISVLLTAATGDRTTVPDARAFAAVARPPMVVTRLVTQGGGHNWPTWSGQLPQVLDWLGQHLKPEPGLPALLQES
jgi:enterochelin esterase-like enzyme